MQLVIRKQPILKSTAYALLCLCLLLFSTSFFPALRLTRGAPVLLVAAISLLARFEGVYYASFFAVIFGAIEKTRSSIPCFIWCLPLSASGCSRTFLPGIFLRGLATPFAAS